MRYIKGLLFTILIGVGLLVGLPVLADCTTSTSNVVVYDDINYSNGCIALTVGDCVFLAGLDNSGSSIVVGSDVKATLYSDVGCIGTSTEFSTSDNWLGDNPIGNDSASSIKVEVKTVEGTDTGGGATERPPVRLVNPIGGSVSNPTGNVNLLQIVGKAVRTAMGVLGSITLLVFFWGAWNWLTSAGAQEKVQKGTKTMVYAVIGLFIIFGAYGILSAIINTLTTG